MNELREQYILLPQEAESLHPHIDWQAFGKALSRPFQQLGEVMGNVLVSVGEAVATASVLLVQAYVKDGTKYGPTSEGMLLWTIEKAEAIKRGER